MFENIKEARFILKNALDSIGLPFPDETDVILYNYELRIICPNGEIAAHMTHDAVIHSLKRAVKDYKNSDFLSRLSIRIDIRGERGYIYELTPGFLRLYRDKNPMMTHSGSVATQPLFGGDESTDRALLYHLLSLGQADQDLIKQILDSDEQIWLVDNETNCSRIGNKDKSILESDRTLSLLEVVKGSHNCPMIPFWQPADLVEWLKAIRTQSIWYGSWCTKGTTKDFKPADYYVKTTGTVQQVTFMGRPHRMVTMYEIVRISNVPPSSR